jgi:hypothetical protein
MNWMRTWGTSEEERAGRFAIDELVPGDGPAGYRGVTIEETPRRIWPWLGQLRLAPYSYDWLDNGMRRSPRHLVPDLDPMAVGDRFMVWLRLADVEPERTVTALCRSYAELDGRERKFHDVAQRPTFRLFNLSWCGVTYRLVPIGPSTTRLLVKLRWRCRPNLLQRPSEAFFLLADTIMMRRQLLNLKRLAESSSARGARAHFAQRPPNQTSSERISW